MLIAVVLECTLFNYRHFESRGNQAPTDVEVLYHGLTDNGDGTFTAGFEEEPSIELNFSYSAIHNIRVDIEAIPQGTSVNQVKIKLYASDEGNTFYYGMPMSALYDYEEGEQVDTHVSRTVLHGLPESQYIPLHLAGDAKQIKVALDVPGGQVVRIHSIELNAVRPFIFNELRVLFVFAVMVLIYLVRPGSELYSILYDSRKRWQKAVIIILAAAQILGFIFMTEKVNFNKDPNSSEYCVLARALAKGQVYLDEKPSDELMALENPYDKDLRSAEGVSYLWDYAYYEGKYYVYFGLMPALVFYLPYYLITGQDLPMHLDFYIMSAGFVIGIFLLVHQLVKKYFRKTPFPIYLLLCFTMIWGIGGLYLVLHPDFYSVPKYFSIVMTVLGLYFWLSSVDDEDGENVKLWRMAVGSLCMACVAGGRTQMVLGSFLAIPIFWKVFIKKSWKETFEKKNILRFVVFILPFVVIAAILMSYNYARFGSVFDFGANYNLTTNDMTRRGMNWDRCGLAVFTFLFQLPGTIAHFPYITPVNMVTDYMGKTITQAMMGGLLVCNPVLLIIFTVRKFKADLKQGRLYLLCLMSIVFAVVIAVVDAQMAGILVGYVGDFVIFLFVPAVILVLCLLKKTEGSPYRKNWYQLVLLLCVVGLIYNVLTIFAGSDLDEKVYLYHKVRYMIEFWL